MAVISTIFYILVAIVVLMLLITVHELGHFTAGKLLGFKINEFAIGFGKSLYSKTNKKGEKFSIRLIPLGGFCAFEGEDENSKVEGAFNSQPAWKRLIVLFGGVLFNFIFGIITAIIFLAVAGYAVPQITNYAPSNLNNFQKNDIIYKVDGQRLESYVSIDSLLKDIKSGEDVTLTIKRDGEFQDITVKKYLYETYYYIADESAISDIYDSTGSPMSVDAFKLLVGDTILNIDGIAFKQDKSAYTEKELIDKGIFVKATSGEGLGIAYSLHGENYSFGDALSKCFPFCFYICDTILVTLGGLFTGATPLSAVGGTVTAVKQIADYSSMGIETFLMLLPLLSMNLALFNALPIPALDGARMVFVFIEMIFRKPINRNVEGWIHLVGLFVLLGLVAFLDVYQLFFASFMVMLM